MSDFTQVIATNLNRFVVMYKNEEGTDRFQWGIVGAVPILTMVGAIARVQVNIINQQAGWENECPESALVIAFGPTGENIQWFINRGIPVDPLVGMLETIKASIIGSNQAQHVAAQKLQLLGPDGNPMNRRVINGR